MGDQCVELIYCRSALFIDDRSTTPWRGGYCARLRGFHEQGEGADPESAIADLAGRLRVWVEQLGADADATLIQRVRRHLRGGDLTDQLLTAAGAATLDRIDEPDPISAV